LFKAGALKWTVDREFLFKAGALKALGPRGQALVGF
jgi:hypothetical protein